MGKRHTLPKNIEIDKKVITKYSIQIAVIEDEIKACENEIQRLKQLKIDVGRKLLPQPVLWDLFYNPNVSSNTICEKFGISNISDLKQIVGSCDVVSKCGVCKKEIRITVNTLTQLKTEMSRKHSWLCDECSENDMKNRREIREDGEKQFGLRLQELKAMDYTDFLKTPEWDNTRKKTLRRAGYKCQLCNKDKTTLNVHHKTYERIGEELPGDLIVLCNGCHAKFHDKLEVRNVQET